jgi:hypothetical protein
MIKFLSIIIMTVSLSACIGSGKNSDLASNGQNMFPSMTGIDLLGEERPLPDSFEGEFNIVSIAFQREQQENVNTWIEAVKPVLAENDNVRYYEVPLIYEMNAMMRGWVNNGMRSGLPSEEARERTITVYTDREKFFDMMNMNEDTIYTLLLNKKGEILWRAEGDATEEKMAELISKIK